jgi:hypothetical protein
MFICDLGVHYKMTKLTYLYKCKACGDIGNLNVELGSLDEGIAEQVQTILGKLEFHCLGCGADKSLLQHKAIYHTSEFLANIEEIMEKLKNSKDSIFTCLNYS